MLDDLPLWNMHRQRAIENLPATLRGWLVAGMSIGRSLHIGCNLHSVLSVFRPLGHRWLDLDTVCAVRRRIMAGLRVLEMAGELACASFHGRILGDLLSTCHFVALFVPRRTSLPARIYTPARFLHLLRVQ